MKAEELEKILEERSKYKLEKVKEIIKVNSENNSSAYYIVNKIRQVIL